MTSSKTVTPDQPQAVPDTHWRDVARIITDNVASGDYGKLLGVKQASREIIEALAARPVLPVETPAEGETGDGMDASERADFAERYGLDLKSITPTTPAPLSGRDGSLREALGTIRDLAKRNLHGSDEPHAIIIDGKRHEGPVADAWVNFLKLTIETFDAALAAVPPETAEMETLRQAFRDQANKLAYEMELNLRFEGRLIAAEIKAERAAEDERDRLYEKAMSLNDHEAGLFLNHVGAMLCADRLAARASSSGEAGDE